MFGKQFIKHIAFFMKQSLCLLIRRDPSVATFYTILNRVPERRFQPSVAIVTAHQSRPEVSGWMPRGSSSFPSILIGDRAVGTLVLSQQSVITDHRAAHWA